MTAPTLDDLVEDLTEEDALAHSLVVADGLDLPTTSWVEGDTTLTIIEMLAYWVAKSRGYNRLAIAGGLLSLSKGGWTTAVAKEYFNVDREGGTYAGTIVTLTNTSLSETFTIAANDVSFLNSSTQKTYHNTSPATGTVTLSPGASIDLDVEADEIGSASSAEAGDIDTIGSGLIGVTCTNAAAAIGRDEESDAALKARCALKIPAISRTAAGPEGKYAYIAVTSAENGGAEVTRCKVVGNTGTGLVQVVLATPSGAASAGDRTLIEAALIDAVVGPTETLSVTVATETSIAVTYQIWIYSDENKTADEVKAAVQAQLEALFAVAPVGGFKKTGDTDGKIWLNLIEATIKSVSKRAFQVEVSVPATDTTLAWNAVATLGAVAGTVHFEKAPATGGTL